ncbi:type 1 glutamine amidotransferase [Neobacillus sp. GCM10023253]|uniref:type 1 glutamine amidotransferase n=1 Tax=Neobacillus sp. GCM10023253 TaxID=3252644 RepID=UPI0036132CD3
MRIHYLQNDPLATLGLIEDWALERNYSISCTTVYENEAFPSMNDFDMLVILGGRMGAYEEELYPWLVDEKNYIKEAIDQDKWVLGICLGAQLLADVLGGNVSPHTHQEIGWHLIEVTPEAGEIPHFNGVPSTFHAFQYHGDTFDLPKGVKNLAQSEGCKNQAFAFGERVVGLQFHPEFSEEIIEFLQGTFGDQITPNRYIQEPVAWLKQKESIDGARTVLFTLLNNMEAGFLK